MVQSFVTNTYEAMFVYHLQEGLGYTMYKGASKKRKLPVRNSNVYLCNTRSKTVKNFHPNNCGAVETGVSSNKKILLLH